MFCNRFQGMDVKRHDPINGVGEFGKWQQEQQGDGYRYVEDEYPIAPYGRARKVQSDLDDEAGHATNT